MKRIAALILLLNFLLCSCGAQNQIFSVSPNKISRVRGYKEKNEQVVYADAFDLYRNAGMPAVQFGTKIYFFYTDDPYEPDYPRLMYIDISNTASPSATPVCTDPNCVHNNENPTAHCIFADLVSYKTLACYGDNMYFSVFDRSCYNAATERNEFYPANPPHRFYTETECPCKLIKYNVTTDTYKVLYDAPAGEYIDDIFVSGGTVYFTLTHYVERPNLVYDYEDGEFFYFRDYKNAERLEKRPVKPFYTNLTERRLRDGETNAFGEEVYITDVYLQNIRCNRMYKVLDGILWEKVYSLMTVSADGGGTKTLVDEIGGDNATRSSLKKNESGAFEEFGEFNIFEGRAYYTLSDGLYTQDINFSYPEKNGSQPPVRLINFESPSNRGLAFWSFQYDEYTHNIYYLAGNEYTGGELRKVKALGFGSRAEVTVNYFNNCIESYQATLDGVYFSLSESSGADSDFKPGDLYFVRWLQINDTGNTAYTLISGDGSGLHLIYPSVVGDYIIAVNKRTVNYSLYDLYLFPCKMKFGYQSMFEQKPPIELRITALELLTGVEKE